ncbi:hypothetical protein [Segatella buccae]|uniref:hypothetical protein n=1 Tax=Segatella buccae TaxID=28126 RepID=UPI00248F0553|nr:hypothetical protein [Segatella buccae]
MPSFFDFKTILFEKPPAEAATAQLATLPASKHHKPPSPRSSGVKKSGTSGMRRIMAATT